MKGFGSGLIWGSVIGAAGLVIVSEVTPMPGPAARDEAAAATETAPAAEAATTAPAATEPAVPDAPAEVPAPESPAAPATPPTEPAAPAVAPAGTEEDAPAAAPATGTGEAPAGSEFSKPPADTEPAAPSGDTGVTTGAAPAVQAPGGTAALPQGGTEAAEAPALDLAIPASPQVPEPAAEAPAVAALDEQAVQTPAPASVPDAPLAEAEPTPADLPPPPPEDEAADDSAPQIVPEGEAAMLPSDSPLVPDAPLPGTAADNAGRPAVGLEDKVAGVTVGRLPRIGDDAAAADAAASATDPADLPPIVRYATAFENPEGKPVFSIVLVDSGEPEVDRARLAALPFPVTFALDPTLPNVEDLAAPYLAAKQEVVMLATAIPQGATAADLEVTFAAHGAALPQAVAVLDLAQDGFQNDRPLASQVVPIVKAQGRGLLTYRQGLNPADQVASREGVRAATVFRTLDAENETPTAIRRNLDRAAFKAAQDGRVVVVGSTRPDTIAALMEWSLEGRAAGVALAPVTGALVTR